MAAIKGVLCPFSLLIIVPLSLTILTISLFGSSRAYQALEDQYRLPSLSLIHVGSISSSLLSGLSAWLASAKGSNDALPIYIAQVALGLHWEPLLVRLGWAWLGCFYDLVHFGTLVMWHNRVRVVSPIAGCLVRACLCWVGFLTYLSFRMSFI